MADAALPKVAGPALTGDHGFRCIAPLFGRHPRVGQCRGEATSGGQGGVERVERGRQRVVHRFVGNFGAAALYHTLDTGAQRFCEIRRVDTVAHTLSLIHI